MNDNTLDNAFWQFACTLYQRPQVAELLLQLQDSEGFNVNMVLFLLWLDSQAIFLTDGEIEHFSQLIAVLDTQVIQPLRKIRRTLKTLPTCNAPYEQLKKVELMLEQELCAALYQHSRFLRANAPVDETFTSLNAPTVYALASSEMQHNLLEALLVHVG